jgi:uncharacterized membrane protein
MRNVQHETTSRLAADHATWSVCTAMTFHAVAAFAGVVRSAKINPREAAGGPERGENS